MSSSLIHRDELVLVVVDIQERLAAAMERRPAVLSATLRLLRTAALIGAPVIVTRQYPKGLGDSEPELVDEIDRFASLGGQVEVVDKLDFCACGEPAFTSALEATARRQVVLVGMETHICIAQTALALHNQGYDVHVPADAVCSMRQADHEVTLDRLRSAGITVTTVQSVMYEAAGAAGTDEFRAMLDIVKAQQPEAESR